MLRSRSRQLRRPSLLTATMAVLLLTPWGCGEQDLYRPPVSPYLVIGVLPLPSANEGVHVLGDYAFVAGGQAGIHSVDISNPANPVLIQSLNTTRYARWIKVMSVPYLQGIRDVAFLVEGIEGVATFDVTRPDSIYSFDQSATATDLFTIYIDMPEDPSEPFMVYAAESWKGIRIFEQDPGTPGRLVYNGAFAGTRGWARDIEVRDGYAYVADDEMGMTVMDVRVPVLGSIRLAGWVDTPGNAQGITLGGDHAFIADGREGLHVMRIVDPENPVSVARLHLDGFCVDVKYRDQKVFLAARDGGVHIVDVSNPARPQLIGTVITSFATGLSLCNSGVVAVSDRDMGLVLLGGPGAFRDVTPPSAVRDLEALPDTRTSLALQWTAPGNDSFQGRASAYDIRYSLEMITEENWGVAHQAPDPLRPQSAGSREEFILTGLEPETDYHVALKALDEAGNISRLSNVAQARTTGAPTLRLPGVSPGVGTDTTLFVFQITYRDPDGNAPVRADLVLNNEPVALTLTEGDLTAGAVFRVETTLSIGSYRHYFAFDDGLGNLVETAVLDGPFVGVESSVMGSPPGEAGRRDDEARAPVAFSRLAVFEEHEVTQEQFEALMGFNPSHFRGDNLPVETVTWYDAIDYCNLRSDADGRARAYELTSVQYDGDHIISASVTWNRDSDGWRLPTEAEWEFACRAGSTTAFANGEITEPLCGIDPVLSEIGWYCGNSGNTTHEVMSAGLANSAGLYDMHGNVREWCWDWYGAYPSAGSLDPEGPPAGSRKVIRGGSWFYFARECRSAARDQFWPNSRDNTVGFRAVRNGR